MARNHWERATPRDVAVIVCQIILTHEDSTLLFANYTLDSEIPLDGWVGYDASSGDGLYEDRRWTSVGYPGIVEQGEIPVIRQNIGVDDVDNDSSSTKKIETALFVSHGWSGGPLWAYFAGMDPRVGGVTSGTETEFSFWDFFTSTHSVFAGGLAMTRLIAWARANWV
jgi:hypothetical protein